MNPNRLLAAITAVAAAAFGAAGSASAQPGHVPLLLPENVNPGWD